MFFILKNDSKNFKQNVNSSENIQDMEITLNK